MTLVGAGRIEFLSLEISSSARHARKVRSELGLHSLKDVISFTGVLTTAGLHFDQSFRPAH